MELFVCNVVCSGTVKLNSPVRNGGKVEIIGGGAAAPVRRLRNAEIHQWIPHSLMKYYLHRGNGRVVVVEALCA